MIDIPLYHWSPTSKRASINHLGLVPNKPSMTSTWRAPYICFAESPSWAWALSGAFHADILEWDLWETRISLLTKPKRLKSYDEHRWHEVRTWDRLYKRDLWYVGTRVRGG